MSLVSSSEDRTDFLTKIGKIMDDPDFRSFFDEYFTNWDDARAVLMILHTYSFVDDEFHNMTDQRLNSTEIIDIVRKLINDGNYRKILADSMQNYLNKDQTFRGSIRSMIRPYITSSANNNILLL